MVISETHISRKAANVLKIPCFPFTPDRWKGESIDQEVCTSTAHAIARGPVQTQVLENTSTYTAHGQGGAIGLIGEGEEWEVGAGGGIHHAPTRKNTHLFHAKAGGSSKIAAFHDARVHVDVGKGLFDLCPANTRRRQKRRGGIE